MMVPQPQDDPDGSEPRAERLSLDFAGPHGPQHEAALQALLEREASSGQSLEWSGNCEQCRDELLRLRELGALLDEAAADRRSTLESARALRHFGDDLAAELVRSKLAGAEPAWRRTARLQHEGAPRLQASVRGEAPSGPRRATAGANGPRWQRALAPWVVTAAGIALVVGWWLRSILPDETLPGSGVSLGSTQPEVKLSPDGPVDAYDEFRWDISAPASGSLVLRIWDNSRADSAEAIHTIRLSTDQRSLRADNLWTGRGPESISWQVEALDSTSQYLRSTPVVHASLRPR